MSPILEGDESEITLVPDAVRDVWLTAEQRAQPSPPSQEVIDEILARRGVRMTLDEAWAEAEAALRAVDPTATWMLEVVLRDSINGAENPHTGYTLEQFPEHYAASAGREWTTDYHEAWAATPTAALQALTLILREVAR